MGAGPRAQEPTGAQLGPDPVAVAASKAEDAADAVEELRAALSVRLDGPPSLVLVFHSPSHDPGVVCALTAEAFADSRTAGCTTAGEIADEGLLRGGMVAFAFAGLSRAAVAIVPTGPDGLPATASPLLAQLTRGIGRSPVQLDPARHLLITLSDGLVGGGEVLLAALGEAAPGMPIVGGSAGDDERLQRTWVWADGQVATASTMVALVEPAVPFSTFAVHHFDPSDTRTVVTRASPQDHRVHELDGWPAAARFAELVGVEPTALRQGGLSALALSKQLGFLVGQQLYMRGVLRADGDDLILGGAVEEGMVLRVADAGDLVAATRGGIRAALDALGAQPTASLQFHCVGRFIQCPDPLLPAMHAAATCCPLAGFSTLGEQYGPLQVNYTLAGVLFGGGDDGG